MIDWNRALVLGGQLAVLVVLGVLVACGHNSGIHDGLMAVAGSIAGVGVYQTIKKSP